MDFGRVEAEFGRLKSQFEQGDLTGDELKAQLQELMIEDEQGRWWIIGYETGLWYVHDGEQWVQQEPPRIAPSPPPTHPRYPGANRSTPDPQPGSTLAASSKTFLGLKLQRDTISVLLITAGWLICWAAIVVLIGGGPLGPVGIAGLIGGLITGLVLRRTEPPSPWKQVPVVTLGWAIGWGIGGQIGWRIAGGNDWYVGGLLPQHMVTYGAIGGFVGGFITALALKWVHPSIQWKHVAIVTLGWGIGWALGGAIGGSIGPRYSGVITILQHALWAGIGAGTGSWVMFWQLREARQSTS